MWIAIVTEIWGYRNKVVLRGGVVDELKVFCLAQLKGWEWFKHRMWITMFSYLDWYFTPVKSCHQISR